MRYFIYILWALVSSCSDHLVHTQDLKRRIALMSFFVESYGFIKDSSCESEWVSLLLECLPDDALGEDWLLSKSFNCNRLCQ